MDKLLLVKLGGSVITDKSKPYTPNLKNIRRFVTEIKKKVKRGQKIILVHGQGSYAHIPAKKYKVIDGMTVKNRWGVALTEFDAVEINRIVLKELLTQKEPAISFSPMSLFFAEGRQTKMENLEGLKEAVKRGLVPVLYGDVIMDSQHGVCIYSGERVIAELVAALSGTFDIAKIIYVSDVKGVLDEKGQVISQISTRNYKKVKVAITGSKLTDVTGGMIHKVEESLSLAKKYGIEVTIGNNVKGVGGTKIIG